MSVSIAPHNPYIFPQTLRVPGTPSIGAANQNLSVKLTQPNTTHAVADWQANGVIERGYVLRPWAEKFSKTIIREGAAVFINRGSGRPASALDPRGPGQTENQPYTIVTIGQLNILLEEGYNEGMKAMGEFIDRHRDMPGLETSLLKYLYLPEEAHAELFEKEGQLIRDDRIFKYFYFFSKRGILERWNFLGFTRKASATNTMERGSVSYMPIDVVFKGPIQVQNIWGENAAPASKTHFVLKRKFDPTTGRYGAFAFHPVADIEDWVHLQDLEYIGIHGGVEYGHVITTGSVLDSLDKSLETNELQVANGVSPSATASGEFEVTRRIPYVWLCIHPRMYGKYNARL